MLKDSQATISCVVTGLTKQLDTVAWETSGGSAVTNGEGADAFKIAMGTYEAASNSQTTILTVPGASNGADAAYNCVITSAEHAKSADKTPVNSNVFSKYKATCDRDELA